MGAAWPRLDIDTSIVGLIRGYACRNRGSNFYVLLISSFIRNLAPNDRSAPLLDKEAQAIPEAAIAVRDAQLHVICDPRFGAQAPLQ